MEANADISYLAELIASEEAHSPQSGALAIR